MGADGGALMARPRLPLGLGDVLAAAARVPGRLTLNDIAAELGCSRQTVARRLREGVLAPGAGGGAQHAPMADAAPHHDGGEDPC